MIQHCIKPGTQTYTDEYDIYDRMEEWGYQRKSVCHSKAGDALDEDDGFCKVHVNTMEAFGPCCAHG
jgi:transposase